MKRTIFFIQILLLLTAGSVFGANIIPVGEWYWWSGYCPDSLWSNPDCWWDDGQDYFPPEAIDMVSIDNPVPLYCLIDSSVTAECLRLHVGDYPANEGSEPNVATLDVNGGTLTVGEDILIGIRDMMAMPGDYAIGDVNIINGTVTAGRNLYIGREGIGILNMRGGTFDVNGTIWCPGGPMPPYDNQTYSSGTGLMTLYGGILSGGDIDVWPGDITKIDIRGGTLIIDGNQIGKLKGYMGEEKLFAYGGRGEVIMDYNVTTTGKTTVTADVNLLLAWGPNPRNYAVDVEVDANLSWSPGDGATKHDVYLGTDYNSVNDANDPYLLPIGRGRQNSNSYDPSLASNTTYYWRIDEVKGSTVYKGRMWEFKVRNLVLAYRVNFISYSFFAWHWLDTNCGNANDCDGCDLDSSGTVDANDLQIFCSHWLEGTEP